MSYHVSKTNSLIVRSERQVDWHCASPILINVFLLDGSEVERFSSIQSKFVSSQITYFNGCAPRPPNLLFDERGRQNESGRDENGIANDEQMKQVKEWDSNWNVSLRKPETLTTECLYIIRL